MRESLPKRGVLRTTVINDNLTGGCRYFFLFLGTKQFQCDWRHICRMPHGVFLKKQIFPVISIPLEQRLSP